MFSIKSCVVVLRRIVSFDGVYENQYVAFQIASPFRLKFQMQTKHLSNIFLIKLNDGIAIYKKNAEFGPNNVLTRLQTQHRIPTRHDTLHFQRQRLFLLIHSQSKHD